MSNTEAVTPNILFYISFSKDLEAFEDLKNQLNKANKNQLNKANIFWMISYSGI